MTTTKIKTKTVTLQAATIAAGAKAPVKAGIRTIGSIAESTGGKFKAKAAIGNKVYKVKNQTSQAAALTALQTAIHKGAGWRRS